MRRPCGAVERWAADRPPDDARPQWPLLKGTMGEFVIDESPRYRSLGGGLWWGVTLRPPAWL